MFCDTADEQNAWLDIAIDIRDCYVLMRRRKQVNLLSDIWYTQECLENEAELDDRAHDILIRFASFLPSPSKLNAASVLRSNSAESLVEWLENMEKRNDEE